MNPQQILEFISNLTNTRFFGSLTLKFEAGKIVILKKEETLKPQDLSGQPMRYAAITKE
jgi:hypothetical protein